LGTAFAFCERIGAECVDLLNRVFSTHLIDFLLSATKQERKSALKMEFLCLSRRPRQCILHVCENTLLQVETFKYLGVVFTSDVGGTKKLIHGLVKPTQFCARADPTGTFRGGDFSNICDSSHYGFTTVREMKYTSQHCCDKTIDDRLDLHRVGCFPNCKKSW